MPLSSELRWHSKAFPGNPKRQADLQDKRFGRPIGLSAGQSNAWFPMPATPAPTATAQVDQIAASIREWGWTNPVLVAEDGTIIAGHGRVLAAHKLGITEVPVMVAAGWTEAQSAPTRSPTTS